MYIESPIGPQERARLVEDLKTTLTSSADKALALSALDDLIHADGEITESERAVVEEIRAAIESVDVSILGKIGRLIQGPIRRRSEAIANAPNREAYLEDFIRNKVYYALRQRLRQGAENLNLPDDALRKLSLAGGLMARVAHVDREVTEAEIAAMEAALQRHWKITPTEAALIAEVAVSSLAPDMDFYRLTREFFTSTSPDERVKFLDVLFAVADADGHVSFEEIEEIRAIANVLRTTHKQFIDAKLKIPRQRRAN
jgi:uncharacterized tellurite resistance protein B-like protein